MFKKLPIWFPRIWLTIFLVEVFVVSWTKGFFGEGLVFTCLFLAGLFIFLIAWERPIDGGKLLLLYGPVFFALNFRDNFFLIYTMSLSFVVIGLLFILGTLANKKIEG